MGKLDGRVAVVTGVSRGIGRAIAGLFAKEGAQVAGCARTTQDGSFLDDLSERERSHCFFANCDIRSHAEVQGFCALVEKTLGACVILVNNAGIVARQSTLSLTEASWNDVLASNLTGTFLVSQAFLNTMKAKGGGRIINLASIAGRQGTAQLAAYCAAKHGVVGLTRSLAEEFRPDGILVNAICPGSVNTAMLKQGMPDAVPKMNPEAVARVALFLAADAPSGLTGACIDVFG